MKTDISKSDWSATDFLRKALARNRLAKQLGFRFCSVSGLEGFEEAVSSMQSATAFFCVSDSEDGYIELDNSPRTRRLKTVFLAMRHPEADMQLRNECLDIMRELFRQIMSLLIMQKTKISQNKIYIDPRITFNEIDRYFHSGAACAFFIIAVDRFTDLRFNPAEWINPRKDIWLISYTDKLHTVKLVKDYTGLSLSETKLLCESAPAVILSDINPDDYPTLQAEFEEVGAVIQFTEHGHQPEG